MGIGKNINNQLEKKGMTVAQLARDSGIAASTIYSIIQRDSDSVSINTLQCIAGVLKIEIWDLIGVDRETARRNRDSLDEFADLYADDKERKDHEFQKEVYEREKKEMVDYYYSAIVPVLKSLGYRSHYFIYNSEHSIILQKGKNEWEIKYQDVKEAISDSFYLADYLLNKHFGKVRKITKERLDALHHSSTKKIGTYNDPDDPHVNSIDELP